MKTVNATCLQCTSKFQASLKETKRRHVKFCSLLCWGAFQKENKKPKTPNVICAYCTKPVYKSPSKQRNSKHGIFFCSRAHKDLGQRLDSDIPEIHPPHYKSGKTSYRKLALETYPHVCHGCSYSEVPSILVVHHKDRDRDNNVIDNLEILCPNCHAIEHRRPLL